MPKKGLQMANREIALLFKHIVSELILNFAYKKIKINITLIFNCKQVNKKTNKQTHTPNKQAYKQTNNKRPHIQLFKVQEY